MTWRDKIASFRGITYSEAKVIQLSGERTHSAMEGMTSSQLYMHFAGC